MYLIRERNVNLAYVQGLTLLHDVGKSYMAPSRNGQVRVANEPVCTHYVRPLERVLFSPQRDANPFFHLFEALWMLTGARDVRLPAYFVPHMRDFSDDGEVFHAAYGHRWRRHFGPHTEDPYAPEVDQLPKIIEELKASPFSRRVILQMWDPAVDLGRTTGKDLPCNVAAKLEVGPEGKLNMTVFNRSNDVVLGCYGANVVQFSTLLEYLAAHIGIEVGWYEQISCNFHAYTDSIDKVWPFKYGDLHPGYEDIPSDRRVLVEPLVTAPATFDEECSAALSYMRTNDYVLSPTVTETYHNKFFHRVALPMAWAYAYYRRYTPPSQLGIKTAAEELDRAINVYGPIDWLVAGRQWMLRRLK